jgi:kanamycin kinase
LVGVPNRRFVKWAPAGSGLDLGALGTADRGADLAVGAWSTEWNYGPGWEPVFYRAYGIEADGERIAFYRDLWDIDGHLTSGRS